MPEAALTAHDTGQVATSAAEVYDRFFVPALFAAWPPRLLDVLSLESGARLLDIGCGTGAATRAAKQRLGAEGTVTGVDLNDGMLAVARARDADGDYRQAAAEALPFADASFDYAISQFALMFFTDRGAALKEMRRVVRPGGRIAVAVWASLATTPGYAALRELLAELFGETAAASLDAPYCLGDPALLAAEFEAAGLGDVHIDTRDGDACFPSLEDWMHTDVRGWTLAETIDDAAFARLLDAARERLARFVAADGSVRFSTPAHIATCTLDA